METRVLQFILVTLLLLHFGACQTNSTNSTNSTLPPPITNTSTGNYSTNTSSNTSMTNMTMNNTMNYSNVTNNSSNWNTTWNSSYNSTNSSSTMNMTNGTNSTWNQNYTMNMTNGTNTTWPYQNSTMNMTNGTNTTWPQNNTMNMTNGTNTTWPYQNSTMNMTNGTNSTWPQNNTMNMTNGTNSTWPQNNTMNMTNGTNSTWPQNNTMNMTNGTNTTWPYQNSTMNMTNGTNSTWPYQNSTMNMTNGTNTTWPQNNTMNMTNGTNTTWPYQNSTMNMTNGTNTTWPQNNTMNMTNGTNTTWPYQNSTMNMTNGTNTTWPQNNTMNMTNGTNTTWPYQNSTMNMTNGTNTTWPQNNTMNMTNGTNTTWPYQNSTMNMTNGTNTTWPQNNTMNMTNGTNTTWPYQNSTMNMTNGTNTTWPQNNTMNMTNGTNTTYPQNNTMNMTNGTNTTWPYQNSTMNMTNGTNTTWPQNNTMNMTNGTNTTYPQNNTMNMTNGTNTTWPYQNSTMNMTNGTNTTWPQNNTMNMTNGTNTTYPQNNTMNMTNGTNTTWPYQNSTMNMTNGTNTTWPNQNVTNGTNTSNPSNSSNTTNTTLPPSPTNTTNNTSTNNSFPTPPAPTYNTTQNFTTNSTAAFANSGFTVNSNLTMAQPPPITSAGLATLYYSNQQNQFFGSTIPETFRVIQSGGSTSYSLDIFNRTVTGLVKSYAINSYSGLWTFITSSNDRLKCSMTYNSVSASYSFVYYDQTAQTFTVKANLAQSSFPTALSSLTSTQMGGVKLGTNCDLLSYGNQIFTISATALTALSFSGAIQASNSNLYYLMSGNTLFKYSATSASYTSMATLNSHTNYWIKQYNNQLVIWGATSSAGTGAKFNVDQTVYVLIDTGVISTIYQHNITSFDNVGTSVPVHVSPQLSKIHFEYRANTGNSTISVYFFDVNYLTPSIFQLIVVNPIVYLEAIASVNTFDKKNYHLGDYYLVVRNDTGGNGTGVDTETTFQFVGQEVIPLRSRDIASNELASVIYMTYIDQYFFNELYVLDLYFNSDATYPGYDIYEFSYGNLAKTIRIVAPVPSDYLVFTYPNNTQALSSSAYIEYDFLNVGTDTIYARYIEDETAANHHQITIVNLVGTWERKATAGNCRLVRNTVTSEYRVIQFLNNGSVVNINATSVLNGITSATWDISTDCLKIKTDANVYVATSNAGPYSSIASTTSWISMDVNMNYVLTATSVLKYDSVNTVYAQYHNFTNLTFSTTSKLYSYLTYIVIAEPTSTTATAYALIDNGAILTQFFSHSSTAYSSAPAIKVSPQVSKLIIYGISSGVLAQYFYYFDFATQSSTAITFPTESVFDPASILIQVQEKWLYIRQLYSASQTISGGNKQYVYQLLLNTIPEIADSRNISASDESSYVQSVARTLANGTLFVLNSHSSTSALVKLWAVFPDETEEFDTTSSIGLSQVTIDGQVVLCSPGCSECATGTCTGSLVGYTFDSSSTLCYACAPGCTYCSSTDPNSCSACVVGAYLSGTDCLSCDATCITCTGSATSCQSCQPGKYFDTGNSSCTDCSRNCLNCTSLASCTACRKGFVVTANGTCRGCALSCSSCTLTNITECTSCASYLQLVNGSCTPCPTNCKKCSNGRCGKCSRGYHPALNLLSCVPDCKLPCKTCTDNAPTSCLSCYRGFFINGTVCSLSMACNVDSSCTDCGQGSNFVLVGANCKRCPTLSNCKQCSQSNLQACAICNDGYFISGTKCSPCSSICPTCVSSTICTKCVSGYILPNDVAQGSCTACTSPCLTCSGSTTYCTSCIDGFTKKNWKCENNNNVGFTITLSANTTSDVLLVIDTLVTYLLGAMGEDISLVELITFLTILQGSVVVSGTGTTTSGTPASTSTSSTTLASTLSSSTSVAGFSVTSSSVVTNGGTTSTSDSSSNTAMIIGLAVGIPVAIILAIIIIYVCYKRNKKVEEDQHDKDVESNIVFGNAVGTVHKEVRLELELPDGSSEQEPGKMTEKEGFTEYVQATANAPVYEPEIEESEDDHNGSPSPIVVRDIEKNLPTINRPIMKPKAVQNTPKTSPKMSEGVQMVQVQPAINQHLRIDMKDEDFGDFVDETPQRLQMGSKKKVEMGQYVPQPKNGFPINALAKAPIAQIEIPDEDEFGQIIQATPTQLPIPAQPKTISYLKPSNFELSIASQSQSQAEEKNEKASEDSRY